MQIPTFLMLEDSMGISSSYCTVSGHAVPLVDKDSEKNAPYLTRFVGGVKNYWQVALIGGIGLGAALSTYLSGSTVRHFLLFQSDQLSALL